MKLKMFGLAAAAAVSLSILTGCPAEEKKETTTTTTTTETTTQSPAAAASAETTTTTTTETHGSPAAAASTSAAAPSAAASAPATKAAVDAKAIFASKCSACHGATGGGGVGPNLTAVDAKGDDYIKNTIANGTAKGMPPFKDQLSAEELTAMVSFVKSL